MNPGDLVKWHTDARDTMAHNPSRSRTGVGVIVRVTRFCPPDECGIQVWWPSTLGLNWECPIDIEVINESR